MFGPWSTLPNITKTQTHCRNLLVHSHDVVAHMCHVLEACHLLQLLHLSHTTPYGLDVI